jgi:hypothetical protein
MPVDCLDGEECIMCSMSSETLNVTVACRLWDVPGEGGEIVGSRQKQEVCQDPVLPMHPLLITVGMCLMV